jgi:hypothetical protein
MKENIIEHILRSKKQNEIPSFLEGVVIILVDNL